MTTRPLPISKASLILLMMTGCEQSPQTRNEAIALRLGGPKYHWMQSVMQSLSNGVENYAAVRKALTVETDEVLAGEESFKLKTMSARK